MIIIIIEIKFFKVLKYVLIKLKNKINLRKFCKQIKKIMKHSFKNIKI